MSRNNNLLLGMILGAVLGVAFAPKKGSELRKELAKDLEEGGHGESVIKNTAVVMGKDIASTAKQIYHDPEVQKHLKKSKQEAKKVFDIAKKNIKDSREEWVEIAREKLVNVKQGIEKKTTELTHKPAKSKPTKSTNKPPQA